MTDEIYHEPAGPYPAVPAFTNPGGRIVAAAVKKKKEPTFPDEVFVRPRTVWEVDDDDSDWLHCTAKPDSHVEVGKSQVVGVYKLVRTVRVSNNVSVTPE